VFNPVLQGQRFDAGGDYIRRWIPELAGLGNKAIHEPWDVGPLELAAAGVILGDNYPSPVVDLATSRARVLAAYAAVRDEVPPD
jgi:deoxyribodipyrimidine photo-lyase